MVGLPAFRNTSLRNTFFPLIPLHLWSIAPSHVFGSILSLQTEINIYVHVFLGLILLLPPFSLLRAGPKTCRGDFSASLLQRFSAELSGQLSTCSRPMHDTYDERPLFRICWPSSYDGSSTLSANVHDRCPKQTRAVPLAILLPGSGTMKRILSRYTVGATGNNVLSSRCL